MTNQTTSHVCRIHGHLSRALDEVDKTLASGVNELVLDFATCTFISVEGLEWLEELLMRADSLKANIIFQNVPPSIYKVFKVAHIDTIARACGSPNVAAPGTSAC